MANEEHLRILKQGVEVWNRWREVNRKITPDLNGANLSGTYLREANMSGAELFEADLSHADLFRSNLIDAKLSWADMSEANMSSACLVSAQLFGANLSSANLFKAELIDAFLPIANLRGSILSWSNLVGADLSEADLTEADLTGAYLGEADLSEADLSESNLSRSQFVETKIEGVKFTGSRVYGISVWRLEGVPKDQSNLIITRDDEPVVTVDNLEVAQFIYLLLNSQKIRYAIDTIAKKAVLILGRFTPERKVVLDAIRSELRRQGYLPILFDFNKPESRDFIETVSTLAHISRFVIADVTDPRIVIEEVPHIVRNIAVPVKPLLLEGSEKHELVTLGNLRINHRSLLKTFEYKNLEQLHSNFKTEVIDPAEQTAEELYLRRIEELAHPKSA